VPPVITNETFSTSVLQQQPPGHVHQWKNEAKITMKRAEATARMCEVLGRPCDNADPYVTCLLQQHMRTAPCRVPRHKSKLHLSICEMLQHVLGTAGHCSPSLTPRVISRQPNVRLATLAAVQGLVQGAQFHPNETRVCVYIFQDAIGLV
jgi:hypothetical protein